MDINQRLDEKAQQFLHESDERKDMLDAVRNDNYESGRTEAGASKRVTTTAIGCAVIVWAVLFLFDFVTGRSIVGSTAVLLALVFGLFWGNYRETRIREYILYAAFALVLCVALCAVHFFGLV